MPRYTFFVDVDIPDPEDDDSYSRAETVMRERMEYEEDYGFDYCAHWRRFKTTNIPNDHAS